MTTETLFIPITKPTKHDSLELARIEMEYAQERESLAWMDFDSGNTHALMTWRIRHAELTQKKHDYATLIIKLSHAEF